jgi:hypothetical protein
MTTQPFFLAPFRYGPTLGKEQTAFRQRKINDITDLVSSQVDAVYTFGELPRQA